MSINSAISNSLNELRATLNTFIEDKQNIEKIETTANQLAAIFQAGGKVLICGNGGSHCDALHFAEEFTGRFRKERKALPALALGNGPHVTCVGNDYGFKYIFSREIEAFGKEGDLLIVLSTSGNSENIDLAVEQAKQLKMKTVALLGKDGGKLKSKCDIEWVVKGVNSDRIQEIHMSILHILIEAVERLNYPENY
jgi:D-sedoheptulose 7-phosphate isomerase